MKKTKLFISQPMRGKTQEQIAKEREDFISKLDPNGVEVIDSIVADEAPSNAKTALWCLSKAIEALSKADAFTLIGYDGRKELPRGCRIEMECAREYGIVLASETDIIKLFGKEE